MRIVAYYHEETDEQGVTRKSVGLEKRETVVDEPCVLEREALECIDMFGQANERLSRRIKDLKAALAALKAQEPVAHKPSDELIEQAFMNFGGKWGGDRWTIEDADLHPFVRSFVRSFDTPVVSAEQQGVADWWVPVSERLPPPGEPVQVWCSGAEQAGLAWVSRHADWSGEWVIPEPQAIGYESITHWMPLPSTPAPSTTEGQGDE